MPKKKSVKKTMKATTPTVKPANDQQTKTRRKELLLAYEEKIFAALRRGMRPVPLTAPLGVRSEILLGLTLPGETKDQARTRIVNEFAAKHDDLVTAGVFTV